MKMLDWVKQFYLKYGIYPITGGDNGGDEAPEPPARPSPEQVLRNSPMLQDLESMIRQYIGKSLNAPGEWGTMGDIYQQLLGYTPQQFQYPLADIQKALEAQQAIQLQQYQNQIRPIMARQGQLDSTYYANLIGDYLKNQQTQSLGNTANLLTNQAQQNFQLSQWLPQFRAGIAGQLGNLGSQKLGLEQQNLMLPLSTYIPGLQSLYGTASGEANQQYQDLMNRYQLYDLPNFQAEQQRRAETARLLGMVSPIGGGIYGYNSGVGVAPSLQGSLDVFKMALPFMLPQASGMESFDLNKLFGGNFPAMSNVPQADMSSLYKQNFQLPNMTKYFNQNYQGYGYGG